MRIRVVVLTCDRASRGLAQALAARLEAEVSEIRCGGYRGVLGRLRAWRDRRAGRLPEITIAPPLGPVDGIVLVGPVWFGALAPPLVRVLARQASLPPILGFAVAQDGPRVRIAVEDALAAAGPVAGPPPEVLLRGPQAARAGTAEARLDAFVAALAPILARRRVPAILPVPRAA